jgi:hypothetical protein
VPGELLVVEGGSNLADAARTSAGFASLPDFLAATAIPHPTAMRRASVTTTFA